MTYTNTSKKMLRHYFYADSLLNYLQGVLQNEQGADYCSFSSLLKQILWKSHTDNFNQYLEQFA